MILWIKRDRILLFSILSIGFFMGCSNPVSEHSTIKKDTTVLKTTAVSPETAYVTDTSKCYIYMTFDDGPQQGTVGCYDLCKALNIKASFFMVGLHQAIKSDGKKIVSMIRSSYPQFLLCNHSYTHAMDKYKNFYQHPQMALHDFIKAQDSLQVQFHIIRLPGNSAWVRQSDFKATHLVAPVSHLLDSAGYNVVGWDLEWNFNHKNARPVQSAEKLASLVDSAFAKQQSHVKKQLVILAHDRMFKRSIDSLSLSKFLLILKANPKYVFETVDHYPGLKTTK